MDWKLGPPDTWHALAQWLRNWPSNLPQRPSALLVISAHWEASRPTVTTAARPRLIYDYSGFPPHTYELAWAAPGSPRLAQSVQDLLADADIDSRADPDRGFDHGVFVPLKLAFPDADVPTVQLSLRARLDPSEHLEIGRALAPLRERGVLIVGSGMSYHNLRGFTPNNGRRAGHHAARFDHWLDYATGLDGNAREKLLTNWTSAPSARECHPREEHLLPLMVACGAATRSPGRVVFRDEILGLRISAVEFE